MMRKTAFAICLGLLLLHGNSALAETRELVIASWGGNYEEGWRKSLVPAFEKQFGVKVIWIPSVSTATIAKLQAQKDRPEIDLAMMDDGPHQQAVALGLVDQIDRSKLAHASELYDIAFQPDNYGIGFGLTASGLYYNTKVFADNHWTPPTGLMDLFRPEFKGRETVHSITHSSGMHILLAFNKLGGGTYANMDPGFAKMKELAPNVLTFDKFGDTPTLIQQEASVIGTYFINSVSNLASAGVPVKFVYPSEGALGINEVITIIKGRPNQDLAYKFIDMMLSKEEQENTAKFIGLGPVNKEAKLDTDLAERVIYGQANVDHLFFPDWKVINANRAAWTERWNKEVEHH
jgi:putative spermidine/putrescine transport system substrate-binding protein